MPTPLTAHSDEELMRLIGCGHMGAFEVFYDRHCDVAFSFARRICGATNLAEDVTQEAFLSLWRHAHSFDTCRGSARTWLLGITRNRAIDAIRRTAVHRRHQSSDEGLEERLECQERPQRGRRHDADLVWSRLHELPEEQRQTLVLAYFVGCTQAEIACTLGVPLGTIKGRLRLGLKKLRATVTAEQLWYGPTV